MQLLFFSHSVLSHSLWPHRLQHARLPCISPSPGVCSNSCSFSWWCHSIILSSVVLFLTFSLFQIRDFSNDLALCIRWSKHWSFSFSISPSNECSVSVSFKIDWFELLAIQRTLKSLLQHYSSKASILQHSAFLLFRFHIHPWLLENP